jgi:hypothetical protein
MPIDFEKLAESVLVPNQLQALINRGYNRYLLGQLYCLISNELKISISNDSDRALLAVDRIRELIGLRYNAEEVVNLLQDKFNLPDILSFSHGCLTSSQVSGLKKYEGFTKEQLLDISEKGLSMIDLSRSVVWGFSDQQKALCESLKLNLKSFLEVREKGFDESKLIELTKEPNGVNINFGPRMLRGQVKRSSELDALGNLSFEFVVRHPQGIFVFPDIYANNWPVMHPKFLIEGEKVIKPVFLCKDSKSLLGPLVNLLVGTYVLPRRESVEVLHYTEKDQGTKKDFYSVLNAFLIAHKL